MKIVSLLYSRGSKNICGMYFFNPIFSVKDEGRSSIKKGDGKDNV